MKPAMTTTSQTAALDLVGLAEIRDLLRQEISKEHVERLAFGEDDFPAPAASIAQGDIWLRDEVAAWLGTHRDVVADLLRTPDERR